MLVANTTLGQHRVNIVKLPIMLNETNMISAKQDLTSLITFFFFAENFVGQFQLFKHP